MAENNNNNNNSKEFKALTVEQRETNEKLNLKDIFTNKTNKQFEIAQEIKTRMEKRRKKLEAGLDSPQGSQGSHFCCRV